MPRFAEGQHSDARRQATSLQGEDATLALVLSYPGISDVRVVQDTVDHKIALDGGAAQTFQALRFTGEIPQDAEGEVPAARLRIDNVGRPLTDWIERTYGGRGATARLLVVQRPSGAGNSEVLYDVKLRTGRIAIGSEDVTCALTNTAIYGRPAVKVRHDVATSPGLY